MDLLQASRDAEEALVRSLRSDQQRAKDSTGKGLEAERTIDQVLLLPNLPPGFRCAKGEVVQADRPSEPSQPIDRIVYDTRVGSPLLHREEHTHSTFPIETVAGAVEITMRLDATKLRTDIERGTSVRRMASLGQRYLQIVPRTVAKMVPVERRGGVAPRNFVIGLAEDPGWQPETIAANLREIQVEIGPPAHVTGLYVLGIGFFATIASEPNESNPYQIAAWLGDDRFLRFSLNFRRAFDRWLRLPEGWIADTDAYVPGKPVILAS